MPARDRALRLFVSLHPPDALSDALLRALRARCDVTNARVVAREQVHLTLQFIGDTERRQLESVVDSIERSAAGIARFELRPFGLIQLPERGRPRLVAAETDAPPGLLDLKRRLAHRLARSPRKDSADRFRPHLTLCRYAKAGPIERSPSPIEFDIGEAWPVDRVSLMSSVLTRDGAVHREERSFALE